MDNVKIFACNSAEDFANCICHQLGVKLGAKEAFKFKNDNTFVKILETVREDDVYVIQTTLPPVDERIMELLITVDALKRSSAKRITAVLPYFPYSRSDKKDQPRVPITARLMADLLISAGVNRVLTCDLHNPAIQGFFNIPTDQLKATDILSDYFRPLIDKDTVVVSTDAGSSKKAYKYAKEFGVSMAMLDKRRDGNNDKAIANSFIGEVKGKKCIIFDDEVDTAGSLMEAVNALNEHGAKEVYAACTHGVLSGPAIERIKESNLKELVITNTIPLVKEKQIDKIKVLDISNLFGQAIARIHRGQGVGELFRDSKMQF